MDAGCPQVVTLGIVLNSNIVFRKNKQTAIHCHNLCDMLEKKCIILKYHPVEDLY